MINFKVGDLVFVKISGELVYVLDIEDNKKENKIIRVGERLSSFSKNFDSNVIVRRFVNSKEDGAFYRTELFGDEELEETKGRIARDLVNATLEAKAHIMFKKIQAEILEPEASATESDTIQ